MRRLAAVAACTAVAMATTALAPAAPAAPAGARPAPHRLVVQEKHVNLDVARTVAQVLRGAGIDVVMTRDADVAVPLAARSQAANRAGADLLVSVHHNASRNRAIRGTEVYYQLRSAPGAEVARAVLRGIVARTGTSGRGSFTRAGRDGDDYYAVLRATEATALIVEGAYVSNPADARALADPAFRRRLGEGMAAGILAGLPALTRRGSGPPPPRAGPAGVALAAPAGLSVRPAGTRRAVASWQVVAGATHYAVWRDGVLATVVGAAGAAPDPADPAPPSPGTVELTDRDVGGGRHRYEVRALADAAGQVLAESPSAVAELTMPTRVVVDPGHGGHDPGAVGRH